MRIEVVSKTGLAGQLQVILCSGQSGHILIETPLRIIKLRGWKTFVS